MANVTIPLPYRARVRQRLKVLAYVVEENGVRPPAWHFALSRITVRACVFNTAL